MAISFRKRTSGSVGLDVDGTFLAAAMVDGNSIGRVASAELDAGVAVDGEVKDPAALSRALKDLFVRHGLPRNVRLGVANQQIVVRHLEMPVIADEAERDAAIRFQAAEAIPMPLEETILDYQVIDSGVGSDRLHVIVVAARETMIARLLGAVRGAGLRVDSIDLNAFALVRALAPGVDTDSARVLCHLAGVTNLAVAQGSNCLFTRPLSTGWKGDSEHAATTLAEEIALSIDFYMGQPEAPRIGEVVLSGPGSRTEGLTEALDALLDFPVSVADPLGGRPAGALAEGEDYTRYTVATGLALGAA